MKNYYTILLFFGGLSKICCTKLDLLQDIQKFYGELFDMHVSPGGPEALRRHLNFHQISLRFTSSFTNPSFQDLNGSHIMY